MIKFKNYMLILLLLLTTVSKAQSDLYANYKAQLDKKSNLESTSYN